MAFETICLLLDLPPLLLDIKDWALFIFASLAPSLVLFIWASDQPDSNNIISIMQIKKLRLSEVKGIAQDHAAINRQNMDLNPMIFLLYLNCLQEEVLKSCPRRKY